MTNIQANEGLKEAKSSNQTTRTIRGRVLDSTGEPLIGVSISVVGTTTAVMTDVDGGYLINIPQGSTQLKYSYIGFKDQIITIGGQSEINITLEEDNKILNEVVVVGYGTQKKATLTGSVTVVGEEMFKDKGTVSNPLQALQGQVPGLLITRSSAAPGEEGWNISIRGAFSRNKTEPLLIIDGVPADGVSEFQRLNSADIESINFLKDASASIYGSKAAGGVILVTTKRPDVGRTKIEYSGSYTYKKVGLQPRLMNMDEWTEGILAARFNDGYGDDETWVRYARLAQANKGGYIDLTDGKNPEPIPGAFQGVADFVFHDLNWTDVLWGGASSTQHNLSASGGNDKMNYRLSVGYLYDEGTLQWGNNSNQQFSARLSNNVQISDRFSIESVFSGTRRNQVAPTMINSVLGVSIPQPGLPAASIDGKAYAWGGQRTPNWLAELGGDNKLVVTSFNINETFKYKILDGLNLTGTFGYGTNNASRDEQYNSIEWFSYSGKPHAGDSRIWPTPEQSSYTQSSARTDNYTVSGYLNYTKSLKDIHNFSLMAGSQYDFRDYQYNSTKAYDIQPELEVINGTTFYRGDTKREQQSLLSYFFRFNYDYKSKYMLDVNGRYDGSSKFLPENRWSFYSGASAGWRITEESFMKGIKRYVDELKLRVSYGEVGNQGGIGVYDGIQLFSYNAGSGAYIGSSNITYIAASETLVSLERTWEKVKNYNIGLDFYALNNRLTGSFDLYMRRNNNMLTNKTYAGVLGGKAPMSNDGKFESKGYDGKINWRDKIGEVTYYLGGTITYMTNELKSGGDETIVAGYNGTLNGHPLNSIFGYRYAGKIQNEDELKAYKDKYLTNNSIGMPAIIRLGDHMYEDVNKDGKLTSDDLVYLGSDDPKYSFSFNFGLEWNNFDFSAIFQGVGKRTIYREIDAWKVPFKAIWLNTSNHTVGKVWSEENPNNRYPTYSNQNSINDYNYMPSSWSVENGAYLRLKNITLGYTLPKSVLSKTNAISSLRVYLSGADLWEKTYINDAWDPEATRKIENKDRYPFNRTFTVGLNATF